MQVSVDNKHFVTEEFVGFGPIDISGKTNINLLKSEADDF